MIFMVPPRKAMITRPCSYITSGVFGMTVDFQNLDLIIFKLRRPLGLISLFGLAAQKAVNTMAPRGGPSKQKTIHGSRSIFFPHS
jgi:hypothetical protein